MKRGMSLFIGRVRTFVKRLMVSGMKSLFAGFLRCMELIVGAEILRVKSVMLSVKIFMELVMSRLLRFVKRPVVLINVGMKGIVFRRLFGRKCLLVARLPGFKRRLFSFLDCMKDIVSGGLFRVKTIVLRIRFGMEGDVFRVLLSMLCGFSGLLDVMKSVMLRRLF